MPHEQLRLEGRQCWRLTTSEVVFFLPIIRAVSINEEAIIRTLGLEPHPERGYYHQTYRASSDVQSQPHGGSRAALSRSGGADSKNVQKVRPRTWRSRQPSSTST
jgi:cupin superfamily protein DUF985